MSEINGYDLSRKWFDFCFENPEVISPNHTALYFFIIEHCNRLGWKEKFGLPMEMAKDALGIKNYRTYSKAFNDLIDFGFIKLIEKSKNQYSANIIAIVKNTTATTKALDKAMQKHSQKQVHGIVGIDKPTNNEQLNSDSNFLWTTVKKNFLEAGDWQFKFVTEKKVQLEKLEALQNEFLTELELREDYKDLKELKNHFTNWYNKKGTLRVDFKQDQPTGPRLRYVNDL